MTRYSVQPSIFGKCYGFSSSAKNIGKNISKNLSCKYDQKHLDHAKQSTDLIKTASKRAIQKTAEATSDLIGNKIADKIIRASKTSPKNNLQTNEEILREKRIFQELRQKVIDYLKLKEDQYNNNK